MRNVHLSTQFILHVKLICFQVACINYVFYTKLAVPARRAGRKAASPRPRHTDVGTYHD